MQERGAEEDALVNQGVQFLAYTLKALRWPKGRCSSRTTCEQPHWAYQQPKPARITPTPPAPREYRLGYDVTLKHSLC
jgi:hypothetical protein